MTAILLAAALLGQIDVPPVEPDWPVHDMQRMIRGLPSVKAVGFAMDPSWPDAVGAAMADLEFMRAVEESAAAGPPAPILAMFRRMGSRSWKEREAASREAEAAMRADPATARWLFAGRRDRDPEVRLRCNAILRRLNPCPPCKGTGTSL